MTTLASLAERIRPILVRHGVRSAAVFGAQARGEAGPESDLDLLVDYPPNASLLDIAGLKIELEEALNKRVDLGRPDCLHPAIRDKVLKQASKIL